MLISEIVLRPRLGARIFLARAREAITSHYLCCVNQPKAMQSVKQTIKPRLLRFSEMSRCSFSQSSKMVLNEICSQFVSFPLLSARSQATAAASSKKRKEEKSIPHCNVQWETEKLVQRRSGALDEFTFSEMSAFPLAIRLSFAGEWFRGIASLNSISRAERNSAMRILIKQFIHGSNVTRVDRLISRSDISLTLGASHAALLARRSASQTR